MKRAFVEVNLARVAENVRRVRSLLKPATKIMGIVKADAYGHGAVEISELLLSQGVEYLGVAWITEAMQLRRAGITAPILILSEPVTNVVEDIVQIEVSQTIYTLPFARALSAAAVAAHKKVKVHIKVDTGMGRIGVMPEDAIQLLASVARLEGLEVEGLFTHFACADDKANSFTKVQLDRFQKVVADIAQEGYTVPAILHSANSWATQYFPETQLDLVRTGIVLYENVLTFKTHVAYVKKVRAQTPISYGSTFVTQQESLIATLSVGYADGFSRANSNNAEVLIRGKRYPVIGRVCMDMCMVDITGSADIKMGDEVVLIGKQGEQEITINEVAQRLNTISYEVMCGIGKRVPRIYI